MHERECSELASVFFDRIYRDEGVGKESTMVPHSDNGAPIGAFTLAVKMAELVILLSFSKPRVSNDNAYAESSFRMMKYHESYPLRRFQDLLSVRACVDGFVAWYNAEHRHTGINYVTTSQRHYGEADALCAVRQQTYEQARQRLPRRWARQPCDWSQTEIVRINHLRPQKPVAA